MTTREARLAIGVVLTGLSFACFTAVKSAVPQSVGETALNMGGYLLAGLSLGMIYRAFRTRT
jgi:hypothetical protein